MKDMSVIATMCASQWINAQRLNARVLTKSGVLAALTAASEHVKIMLYSKQVKFHVDQLVMLDVFAMTDLSVTIMEFAWKSPHALRLNQVQIHFK